jgi:prophage antirepressor-like protein
MNIVKAFTNNELSIPITIAGTWKDPVFRASDIGDVLGLKNIRPSLQQLDEEDKVLIEVTTLGGPQQVTYVTEHGLYTLVSRSQKPFGKQFRKWVFDVVKEIRINGRYDHEEQERIKMERELADQKEEIDQLRLEVEKAKKMQQIQAKNSVIYIWMKDERATEDKMQIKVGITNAHTDRFKPFRQVDPYGAVADIFPVFEKGLKATELYVHNLLSQHRDGGEVFNMSVDAAKPWIASAVHLMNLSKDPRSDKHVIVQKIADYMAQQIHDIPNPLTGRVSIETQTDEAMEPLPARAPNENQLFSKFDEFVKLKCTIGADCEVSSKDLEGAFRLWSRNVGRDIHEGFLEYARTQFQPVRLALQTEEHVVNGFRGIKLKPTEYKPSVNPSDVETFLFQECTFSPSGKELTKDLLEAFQKWKTRMAKDIHINDIKTLKTFLRDYEYVLPACIWTSNGNGIGYYGIQLKSSTPIKKTSSTGKSVFKRNAHTHEVVNQWTTVAKAAVAEKMPAAKMSRMIKNAVIVDDHYYTSEI